MLELNVGCSFDMNLIPSIAALNNAYKSNGIQVKELYGSLPGHVYNLPTARPDFRIPQITTEQMRDFIERCHDSGFRFNYTLNSPLTQDWFNKTEEDMSFIMDTLFKLGIDNEKGDLVTVSHMIPLSFLYKHFDISISTIMEIQDINAIQMYIKKFDVKKICLSLNKNRDFRFLREAHRLGLNTSLELLSNEFCIVGDVMCQNVYRKSCYELHALGGNKENKFHGYPMKLCSASRFADPASWLRARAVFPWDTIRYFEEVGINQFKISGRTLPMEFILKTIEAYLSLGEKMDDNMLNLWGHVDKVGTDDLMKVTTPLHISAEKLKSLSFLDYFINGNFNCQDRSCEDCRYCDNVLNIVRA